MKTALRASILLVALAASLAPAACSTLSEQDQVRLSTFKQNSKRYYEEGQFRRAEDQCHKGLQLDDEDVSLHQVLGFALLRQGTPAKVAEAVATFERCLDLEGEFDPRSRLGLGEANLKLAQIHEGTIAALVADERLTLDERDERIEELKAQRDRSFQVAEEALGEVLATPDGRTDVTVQSAMARLYSTQGRYVEAAEVLRSLVGSISNSLRVREERVAAGGLDAETISHLQRQIRRLEDQLVESLGLLAIVASKTQRWEEVVSAYARLEALDRMQPADYYNRGVAYEELGAVDAAIQNFETFTRRAAGLGANFGETGGKIADAMRRRAELEDRRGAGAAGGGT